MSVVVNVPASAGTSVTLTDVNGLHTYPVINGQITVENATEATTILSVVPGSSLAGQVATFVATGPELPNGYAETTVAYVMLPIPTSGIANAQDVPGLMVQVTPTADMVVDIIWQYPVQNTASGFVVGNFNCASLIDDAAMSGGSTYAQAEVDRVFTIVDAYGTCFYSRRVRRMLSGGVTYRWKISVWVGSGTPTAGNNGNMATVIPASIQVVQVG